MGEGIWSRLARKARCSDHLSDDEIAHGAHACYLNTRSLLRDARLLCDASPGRAISLTVLALEELGKIPILFDLRADAPVTRWKQFWREEFSRHSFKQAEIARYGRYLAGHTGPIYELEISAQMADQVE